MLHIFSIKQNVSLLLGIDLLAFAFRAVAKAVFRGALTEKLLHESRSDRVINLLYLLLFSPVSISSVHEASPKIELIVGSENDL